MLRVSLLGNLGAEPESRFTQKGNQIVQFRVAVNQVRIGPDGERQENTEWFRVRVSGRQTDYVQRLGKGTRVLVFGRLDISHFQSKDGEARTGFDVWADDVQSVSAPRSFSPDPEVGSQYAESEPAEPALAGVSSLSGGGGSGGRPNGRSTRQAAAAETKGGDELEDLPF
jgi:single-strand DNA-binding protein